MSINYLKIVQKRKCIRSEANDDGWRQVSRICRGHDLASTPRNPPVKWPIVTCFEILANHQNQPMSSPLSLSLSNISKTL